MSIVPETEPLSILVAGVGNIFLGDDGFGPEVARYLATADESRLNGVSVVDYGTRGIHLAYDLLDGVDALIIVDAIPAAHPGETTLSPGQIRVSQIREQDVDAAQSTSSIDPHGMEPAAVLGRLRFLGAEIPLTYLVGCAAAEITDRIGLSDAMAAAVPAAAQTVWELVDEWIPSHSPSLSTTRED